MESTIRETEPLINGVQNKYGEGVNYKTKAQDMEDIKKAPQMWKFCFYGFFKNLKLFEAFLVVVLMGWGLNLFQIGLLKGVEQVSEYVLEIPSGMLADRFGNKFLTMACFLLYIVSFLLYAMGAHWATLVSASIFFGFGQAFRAGSHKAMILIWLDIHGYTKHKKFVYGRSRSWSMLGSALSSLLGCAVIVFLRDPYLLFLISTVPYALDFILIATYPKALNATYHPDSGVGFCGKLAGQFKDLCRALSDRNTTKILVSTALFNAIHQTLKDFIQPIVVLNIATMMASLGHPLAATGSEEGRTEIQISLAVAYCVFYLLSSVASSKAYLYSDLFSNSVTASDLMVDILALTQLGVGICLYFNCPLPVFFFFMITYVLHSARKPLMLSAIGDVMSKEQRATVLSVESMLKTTIMFVFAPLAGFIVHRFSMQVFFLSFPPLLFLVNRCFLAGASSNPNFGDI